MSNERNSNRMTRRGALGVITVGVGATVAGVIAVPVAGYIAAPVTEQVTFQAASLGPVTGFTAERGFQPTATPFVEDPAQPLTSSQLAYVHYTGGGSADWLSGDAMFVVFSNRCTHVGCPAQATATSGALASRGRLCDRSTGSSGRSATTSCGSPSAGAC